MTSTEYKIRSQDEIVARIREYEKPGSEDLMFGWRRDVLLLALDYDHAKPFLNEDATREAWDEARPKDVAAEAKGYLEFAIGKIQDHRGISASRSVERLREYAWLLDQTEAVVNAMDLADYPQYGAPQVKAFAVGMGWPWPDDAELNRMAQGLSCIDDCEGGCGS